MMWEMALLLVAITYAVINFVYLAVMIKFIKPFGKMMIKSAEMMEAMMDEAKKDLCD